MKFALLLVGVTMAQTDPATDPNAPVTPERCTPTEQVDTNKYDRVKSCSSL